MTTPQPSPEPAKPPGPQCPWCGSRVSSPHCENKPYCDWLRCVQCNLPFDPLRPPKR